MIRVWLVNCLVWLHNLWRWMLRRRVDYVRIELSGRLPEFVPQRLWWQRRFMVGREVLSLQELRRRCERIAADEHTRGVLFVVRDLTLGWATLESVRDLLAELRAAGKRVTVYLFDGDIRSYALACAADEILMPPPAFLNLLGLRVEVTFLKDTLALAGVEAEVTAVSPYKSAGEQFVRSDISPENREQLDRLLDARFDALVEAVAIGRGLVPDNVRALIDRAPYSAPAARDLWLIDGICYEDELEAWLKNGDEPAKISDWDNAQGALRRHYLGWHRKLVAVVSVEGAITNGTSRRLPLPLPLIGGEQAGADSVTQALRRAERSKRVAAVVLQIDSPGGDAYASDLIWREVLRLRRKKPVVVAMGNVAASGGYYIAAPANAIIAQPGTLTGSIGVVSLRPIAAGLYEKLGVHLVELQRGQRSGMLAISRPPNDDERAALREVVFTIYDDFKQRVCEGRQLSTEQLTPIAGGRVWTGREALALRLVDGLGGLPEAVVRAQELAGLPRNPQAPLLRLSASGDSLPPEPFSSEPAASLGTLLALLPDALSELVQTRLLTRIPFDLR